MAMPRNPPRPVLPKPVFAGLLILLAACAPLPDPVSEGKVSKGLPLVLELPAPLPPVRRFSPVPPVPALRPNVEIAQDFLDLTFRMESGRTLPALTRFDGPITVALQGRAPETAADDLEALLARLRKEAGLNIRRTTSAASITVSFHPKSDLQQLVPTAACFVVPNVSSLAEYRAQRGAARVDWARLTARSRVAIFVPDDTSPQEVRDCLHEEIAQALGPLNDLYRLPDSVFNDDNFHAILTGFDMLILRLHYAPDLANGMTSAEVAQRLPGLLARLNPQGERPGTPGVLEPRSWIDAIETAFGSAHSLPARARAADRALSIARSEGWQDARLGFSYFVVGRLNSGVDTDRARAAFLAAQRVFRTLPGAAIHSAHVDMQLAAYALSRGDAAGALALADAAIPVVRSAQNAALLATLLQVRAEALDSLGRPSEAGAARLQSLGWARYGFGSDVQVIGRLADIAALAARGREG